MIILGLNVYHGDSSACLINDGKLVAAVEEERFRRIKHWAGFPREAINYCLEAGSVTINQVDHIAVNRNPRANLLHKVLFAFYKKPSLTFLKDRTANAVRVKDIRAEMAAALRVGRPEIKATIHNIEHHCAHLASSFFVSPFESAAVVSVDGFGDFVSTKWGIGDGCRIAVQGQVHFPHSLGLFYLAITQYLGFMNYGDEYKVMGLAPYGNPTRMDIMRQIVHLEHNGRYKLNLDCFLHHSKGVSMVWDNVAPEMGKVYSDELIHLLGPARSMDEPLSQYHKDIAASLQAMYEEAFFHILDHVYKQTKNRNLCLAGGCAMNSVANGKIFDRTTFNELYIQPAAGDSGGAIGAAYMVWHQELAKPRSFVMNHAYWGPGFSDSEISTNLRLRRQELYSENCIIDMIENEMELCQRVAENIAAGKVVGWFQGRMEWGPRALGNRSILCDPRRADMKDILNTKIKRRESFRPFAPSIVREAVKEWFETDYAVPFMLQVYYIRKEKRQMIPAVTHVNGSGRLQTVTESQNRRYYHLIKEFEKISGVPIVLNTSFNENEPVVCTPQEALECFLRAKMDCLVLGNWVIARI